VPTKEDPTSLDNKLIEIFTLIPLLIFSIIFLLDLLCPTAIDYVRRLFIHFASKGCGYESLLTSRVNTMLEGTEYSFYDLTDKNRGADEAPTHINIKDESRKISLKEYLDLIISGVKIIPEEKFFTTYVQSTTPIEEIDNLQKFLEYFIKLGLELSLRCLNIPVRAFIYDSASWKIEKEREKPDVSFHLKIVPGVPEWQLGGQFKGNPWVLFCFFNHLMGFVLLNCDKQYLETEEFWQALTPKDYAIITGLDTKKVLFGIGVDSSRNRKFFSFPVTEADNHRMIMRNLIQDIQGLLKPKQGWVKWHWHNEIAALGEQESADLIIPFDDIAKAEPMTLFGKRYECYNVKRISQNSYKVTLKGRCNNEKVKHSTGNDEIVINNSKDHI